MQLAPSWSRRQIAISSLVLLFLSLFSVAASQAQATQQFTGHVTDSSGAAIAEARVVIHNQATGVDTKTITTGVGDYTVPYLQPSTYSITVSKAGFKTETKTDILLSIEQTSTISFSLSVGAVTEQITVDASASQIELSKSDRSDLIDPERVAELPLDSRNVYSLFAVAPGTHNFSNPIYPRPFDDVTDNMYANGSPQQPSLNLDGISNDSGGSANGVGFGTNPGIIPSVDSVADFKIVLGAADASYGQGGGNSIDIGLKTGTNRLHGVLDYYKRASWLDTVPWQSKYQADINDTSPVKPPHARTQYSLEFDGPVVIPHLFNGKDKLFFTFSYEFMRDTLPNQGFNYSDVPNPAWLTGNFAGAQFYDPNNNSLEPWNIYDVTTPLQSVIDPNQPSAGLKQAHTQGRFAGNIIPQQYMDPVGKAMVGYLAGITPNNNPGPGYTPWTHNYAILAVENDIWRNGLVKVDYALSDNDRLSFHWSGQGRWQKMVQPPGWPTSATYYALINANSNQIEPKAETGAAQWTHTFSPTLLFDFHTTLMSTEDDRRQGDIETSPLAGLPLNPSFAAQLPNYYRFPYVSWSQPVSGASGTSIGVAYPDYAWRTHALDFLPTLTYIRGQHSIRAGLDVQLQQVATESPNNSQWNFGSNYTNEFYGTGDAPGFVSGNAFASGLLGYMSGGSISVSSSDFESQHYIAPWVQDDWKITRKLTLNLGLRWDFQQPRTVRGNRVNGPFNTAAATAIPGSSQILVGAPTFAGVNGVPNAAYKMNMREWQPRVGFAYAIRPTLSVRGFVAKSYPRNESINGNFGYSANTSYYSSVDAPAALGAQPYTIDNGFGAAPGLADPYASVNQPIGASEGNLSNIGNAWSWDNPNYRGQSLWNYDFVVEAALTKHDTISASYVGNYSGDQPVGDNINHPSAAFYQQCNGEVAGWQTTAFGAPVPTHQLCDNQTINGKFNNIGYTPNVFKGVSVFNDGAGYYSQTNTSRADLTRPFFGWWDLNENGATNNGRNWYNAETVSLKHQATHDVTVDVNYTHAKAIYAGGWDDTTYRVVQRQVSGSNTVKHAINLSGVVYLPFGRNRHLFTNVNRIVDEAINGWEFSPIVEYYSGFPWRPGGTWEWNKASGMGVSHQNLAAFSGHNYKSILGVDRCVGYRNSDTGIIVPSPAAVIANCPGAAAAASNNTSYGNADYVQAGDYAVPTNVVDFGVTQPGALHFDAAVAKNFSLPGLPKAIFSEKTNLQLRVDILNALNHPTFDEGYDGNPGDTTWGTISKGPNGPTNTPRYLQLSARLNW